MKPQKCFNTEVTEKAPEAARSWKSRWKSPCPETSAPRNSSRN